MNATAISLEEYLSTTYEPDREYVDGQVLERKGVGTQLHSILQTIIAAYLRQIGFEFGFKVLTEGRLFVGFNRHRIPDVMALAIPFTKGKVVTDVPLLTVEINSPDDSFEEILEKCFEYEAIGVRNIFVIDPDHQRRYVFTNGNLSAVHAMAINLPNGEAVPFPIEEMFGEMQKD